SMLKSIWIGKKIHQRYIDTGRAFPIPIYSQKHAAIEQALMRQCEMDHRNDAWTSYVGYHNRLGGHELSTERILMPKRIFRSGFSWGELVQAAEVECLRVSRTSSEGQNDTKC